MTAQINGCQKGRIQVYCNFGFLFKLRNNLNFLCVFSLASYEQQAESLRNQSFNMEQANYAAQSMKDTQITVAAMKDGVKQMQKEFKKIDIDQIEDIQDDMADMLEQADEVQDALGRTYGMPEVDDDELAAELEALGDEIALDDDTSYLDDVVKAPAAPDREPGADSIISGNKVCI